MMSFMRNHARSLMLAAAVAALAACDDSTAPISQNYQPLPADYVIEDMNHVITSDGVRRAHLTADTAYQFNDSTVTHLRVVKLEMFDDAGTLTSTVTSEQGAYSKDTQTTVARGDVVVTKPGPEGFTLWTEELHYDPGTKRVWSDVATRVLMNDGQDLHGEGFTADDQLVNINITGASGTGLPLPLDKR